MEGDGRNCVPRDVDDEVTLQLLRPPTLEGPLTIADAIDALRRSDALLRNVPFMRDQRLELLRWSEAWLQLGINRLEQLARERPAAEFRPTDQSRHLAENAHRDVLDQSRQLAEAAHRDVLDLIQQVKNGQVFELVGFARYNLSRAVAVAQDQARLDREASSADQGW